MLQTIYLATDHAGYAHKNAVKEWLIAEDFEVKDCGAYTLDEGDDFTDFISQAAQKVSVSPSDCKAIIFGGSGQGEAMLANRFIGVRAAVYYGGNLDLVTLSRKHNDANILSIGARFLTVDDTKEAIWKWLHTEPLVDKKYVRRNHKIDIEAKHASHFLK